MEHGPVDVIAVALGSPQFDGSIIEELERAAHSGVIRVLDAMVLVRDVEGGVVGIDLEDLPAEDKARLGFIETGTRGLFDTEDSELFAEGLVPGSALVVLAIEHVWAIALTNAFYRAGGEVALSYRVPAEVVNERFAALAAGE